MYVWETIKLQFEKESHTLLCILKLFTLFLFFKLCSKFLRADRGVKSHAPSAVDLHLHTWKASIHAYKMYSKCFLSLLQSTDIGRLENWRVTDSRKAKFSVFILERVTTSCDKRFWWSLDFNVVPSFPERVTPVSPRLTLKSFLVNSPRLEGFFFILDRIIIIIIHAGIIYFV